MSKYIILYRIKDEYDGCRYIELNSDGTMHLDYNGKPIVSNARCCTRIDEDFEDVETWVTEDVFNRMKNTDGNDTFSDNGLGEKIIEDGCYYEHYDGRVVQYNY